MIAGGVFNSGVLAGGDTFDYEPAPPGVLARVERLRETCARHGVPLPAAAMQFPLRPSGRRHRARRLPHAATRSTRTCGCSNARRAGALWERAGVIVDAHQHFWDPALADYPWMTDDSRRAAAVGSARRTSSRCSASTASPAPSSCRRATRLDETQELLAIAAATPFVLGVVGWVDLTAQMSSGSLPSSTARWSGVRHQVHDEPDPAWLLRDDVQRGLAAVAAAGLVYDLLVRTRELPAAVETARRHPELRFVLDHAGKAPPLRSRRLGARASRRSPSSRT